MRALVSPKPETWTNGEYSTGTMIDLTVYGGVGGTGEGTGEIGGNKILLELPDRTFFLDFGIRFSLSGRFFEEFLKVLLA